jgi:DNA polymerase-3 subunit delta'
MRISHAYIFYGPEGVGKALAASHFAKAVNCAAAEAARPCGECPSCRKADSSNHPDISVLKPRKGASVGIDDIRALIKDVGMKPYEGRKKFYIIDDAHGMKEEASNALLKTLEEPPSDSVIILISDSLGSLLSTIVSRSQTVKFFPLRADEIRDILVKRHGIEPSRAHVASRLASGRLGEAIRFSDDAFFVRREKALDELAKGTFFESDFEKLTRPDLGALLSIALTWYRDALIAKAVGTDHPSLINIDRKDAIAGEARRLGADDLHKAIRCVVSTLGFIQMNANPKLAMAALGVEIG